MRRFATLPGAGLLISGLLTLHAAPGPGPAGSERGTWSPELMQLTAHAASEVLGKAWATPLTSNQLAVTVVDLGTTNGEWRWGSFRGSEPIYPASVVKLFYLVAAHRWIEDGRLVETDEFGRAMRDMIVDSSNEATHYVVDLLTGTTSGPELGERELEVWRDRRDAVNRYFESMGYRGLNVNKKPWCEGPYGREMQAIRRFEPRRNWLTTDATARLMAEVATDEAVSRERSRAMLALMARDPWAKGGDPEDQARGFTGLALRPGMRLWSKAGWTSEVRHDAALIGHPRGGRLVVVVFTTGHATEREIVPSVVRSVLEGLRWE